MKFLTFILLMITTTAALCRRHRGNLMSKNPKDILDAITENASCITINKYFNSDLFETLYGVKVNSSCKINCQEFNKENKWGEYVEYANEQEDKVKGFVQVVTEKTWALMGCDGISLTKLKKVRGVLTLLTGSKFSWKGDKPIVGKAIGDIPSIEKAIRDKSNCAEVNKYFDSDLIKTYFGVEVNKKCKLNCTEFDKNGKAQWEGFLQYANKQQDLTKGFLNVVVEKSFALIDCNQK